MYKKTMIASGIAIALAALPVMAEEGESWLDGFEVSGELKNETAVFTKAGTTIGASTAHDNRDVMKSETSARFFINGPVGEGSEVHAEIRPVRDAKTVDGMKGHESYTQQDFLRELYVDTTAGEEEEVSLRLGKQQVVWGTADGMKLLDIINPTDYREMAQNSMDESRIPVWMINAETDLEDGSNVQVVISQPKENVFAGLDRNISTAVRGNSTTPNGQGVFVDLTTDAGHAQGHPFMMKGVDSITGKENGFLNIVPDLGSVARAFANGFGGITALNPAMMAGFTVGAFEGMDMDAMATAMNGGTSITWNHASSPLHANFQAAITNVASAVGKTGSEGTVSGEEMLAYGFAPAYDTNLTNYSTSTQDSTFDYMGSTTFRTFDAFVNAKSQYVYNMPTGSDLDLAMRVKRSLDNGLNYSLNYSYNYDKNPIINLSWRNSSGEALETTNTNGTLSLSDAAGGTYGGAGTAADPAATLRFEQTVKRAHNVGSALDYALDTEGLGAVVLRGELLYQKDVYSPTMDLTALSIGDLPNALKMEKGNRFKYVLGADVTVMTNMMVSAQFIQDRNLDHIDTGTRFTSDYSTMHLTNNFNKAEKNKEFYSLFFSKPFGGEQQHRWNNILMLEENGGRWNRFDVEYSFNDEVIGSFEYDKYWGDANTQFGQLEASSNLQLGLKYIF